MRGSRAVRPLPPPRRRRGPVSPAWPGIRRAVGVSSAHTPAFVAGDTARRRSSPAKDVLRTFSRPLGARAFDPAEGGDMDSSMHDPPRERGLGDKRKIRDDIGVAIAIA